MSDLNMVMIGGRVTANATKELKNGLVVVSFGFANNKSWQVEENGKKEWKSSVRFFNTAIFGDYAESKWEKLKKGVEILVIGSLTTNEWEKEGTKIKSNEISVKTLKIFDTKKEKENEVENNSTLEDILDTNQNLQASDIF